MATHKIINGLIFQCCWFLALLVSWQTALMGLGLLLIHGIKYEPKQHHYPSLLGAALLGMLLDTLWINLGYVVVSDPERANVFNLPLWLMITWVGFVLTVSSSLSWMSVKTKVFPWVCMILGPVSYMAGERLGVIELSRESLVILAGQWWVMGWITSKIVALTHSQDWSEESPVLNNEAT